MKTKSALSYYGSDSEVAPKLASLLSHCKHVTIPFVGGASIIPHLNARAIVANDLHDLAIKFYRVLSAGDEDTDRLIRRCQSTLSHPAEMREAEHWIHIHRNTPMVPSRVDLAWSFWAVCWLGRKGKGGTRHQGGLPSIRRTASGGTNASRVAAAADDLHEWAECFRRCEWECRDFRLVVEQVKDIPHCGIYCDPPWFGAGRNYLHGFTNDDHRDLAMQLQRFREATVVVRYGDDPTVRELYAGWQIIEAESRTQSNAVKGEVWITNHR